MARAVALVLGLAVLLLHLVLLQTLGTLWQAPSRLQAMATPMFTRELASSVPPPVVASQPAPQAAPPRRPHEATRPKAQSLAKEQPQPSVPDTGSATTVVAATSPPESGSKEATLPPASAGAPVAAGTATSAASAAQGDQASVPVIGPTPSLPQATLTTATSPPPPPDNWPADTRLSYKLTGNYRGPIGGDARVQWQRDGSRYQVQVDLGLSGVNLFTMTSQGRVTPNGLVPSTYEEKRLGTNPLQLAMGAEQIRLYDGKQVDRPAEAQDTASQFVELGHRFATGRETLEVGKAVQLWLARPAAVAEWTYDIVDLETLHSPRLGAIEAYHLKPRPLANPSGPITAEMWFAPSLQYLPVRIKITMNKETWVDLLIDKIEQAQPAAAPPASPNS